MKRENINVIILMSCIQFFLVSCISASNIQRAEIIIYNKQQTRTLIDNIRYADALANQYIILSDQASSAQDITALGIITSAGIAAGGILYDANLNLVKGAGLAAGTLTATSTYFRPGETTTALLDAAEQLVCIRKAGEPFVQYYGNDPEAAEVVKGGILTVRLNLRKRFNRTLPDYRALVETLKQSLITQKATSGVEGVAEIVSLEVLRASVASCLLPSN